MKLVNYALQTQMENLGELKTNKFFKEYIKNILEDDTKPFYQKCDYVGSSLNELKAKIDYLALNIKELQDLKSQLTVSMDIAKELTAEVFLSNGVDRIDGNIISSLTLTKPSTKTKETITVTDPNAVMGLGYVKFDVDMEAIEKAMQTEEGLKELDKFVTTASTTVKTLSKIKVNMKKSSANTTIEADEILDIEHKQAA